MLHGVRLRDGRAEWYRNRWIRTGRFTGRPFVRPDVFHVANACEDAAGRIVLDAVRYSAAAFKGMWRMVSGAAIPAAAAAASETTGRPQCAAPRRGGRR